jgi:DNA-binding LacI/PurR family transcriptional regulator
MSDKSVKTIADIADICCVSKSTVSRALNDSPQISDETKERIRTVAKEHRFQINIPARRLSLQRSHTIGFVVHTHDPEDLSPMRDLFSMEILGAISSTLSTYHYDMLVANVDPRDPDWPCQYVDTGRVDGFILLTAARKQSQIKSLINMGTPFIVWGVPFPNQSYCSVINDNFDGGRKATDFLLKKGKQRIAFIGGPADEFETQQRYNGYAAALQASGLEINPALVTYGEWTNESGAAQAKQILAAAPDVDAIFANSDLMAIGAINHLQAQGRCVPRDVAVVGYDNVSLAKLNNPPLTTISQNIPLVGKLLGQNLIQNIETGLVSNVTVPAELVIRGSA